MNIDLADGKLLSVQTKISDAFVLRMDDDTWKKQIKENLAKQLADMILQQNLIEFTQMNDPYNNTRMVTARVYLVSKDQISKVRKNLSERT